VRWATTGFQLEGYFTLASVLLAMGDPGGALERLEPARALVPRSSPNPLLARLEGLEERARMDASPDEAAAWAVGVLADLSEQHAPLWPWLPVYRLAVRILTDCGRISDALQAASRLAEAAERNSWPLYIVQMRAAVARCHWLAGGPDEAVAALLPAIGDTKDEHLVQLFADAGPEVRSILNEIERRSGTSAWLRALAGMFPDDSTPTPIERAHGSHPVLPEPLSERELEVLEQISLGKSNNEIADGLYLAVGTVKRHTHNIYGKLGVQSRTQAVARARQLGLLLDR
jgi:LuxR family maltose regulon positive regulatory protein